MKEKSPYMGWDIPFMISKVSDAIQDKNINLKQNLTNTNKKLLYTRMTVENSTNCYHDKEGIRAHATSVLSREFNMDTSLIKWEEYIDELCNYKFCLSLPGKGLDCYRTWEALTLGVIPVVIRTKHMDCIYDDLPVVIVDRVEDITKEFLDAQFERIRESIERYNYNKLTSSYWIDFIFSHIY